MIQALERAANILRIVADSKNGLQLSELARCCGLNRHTVYNLAETLVKERLLAKTPDKNYVIGDGIGELADQQCRSDCWNGLTEHLARLHLTYPDATIYYSELSGANVAARIHFSAASPGLATYPSGTTINPYLTVAGLVFFAFGDEARVHEIEVHNPFDFSGQQAWRGMKQFMRQVAIVKDKGYAETPHLLTDGEFKIGLPVWRRPGELAGAITFHLRNIAGMDRNKLLEDVLRLTRHEQGGTSSVSGHDFSTVNKIQG